MIFQQVKAAAVQTLGDNSAGRFNTIGYQVQSKSAETLDKLVQCYFAEGDFKKSGSSIYGPRKHDMTLAIELTASAAAKADLAILEDDAALPAAKQAALAAVQIAVDQVDTIIDQMISDVFGILTDATKSGLGLPDRTIANQWFSSIRKDQTLERGGLAVKTAVMNFTCSASEPILGDNVQNPIDPVMDATTNINDDPNQNTGVSVNNTGG